MSHGTFVTTINCMDGRTQNPVNAFLKNRYGVDYVDTITEPGPDGILASATDEYALASLKKRVDISCNKHGSKVLAIVAHAECAGNPVEKEVHLQHLQDAKKTVLSWGFPMEVILLWVGDTWEVTLIEG